MDKTEYKRGDGRTFKYEGKPRMVNGFKDTQACESRRLL